MGRAAFLEQTGAVGRGGARKLRARDWVGPCGGVTGRRGDGVAGRELRLRLSAGYCGNQAGQGKAGRGRAGQGRAGQGKAALSARLAHRCRRECRAAARSRARSEPRRSRGRLPTPRAPRWRRPRRGTPATATRTRALGTLFAGMARGYRLVTCGCRRGYRRELLYLQPPRVLVRAHAAAALQHSRQSRLRRDPPRSARGQGVAGASPPSECGLQGRSEGGGYAR